MDLILILDSGNMENWYQPTNSRQRFPVRVDVSNNPTMRLNDLDLQVCLIAPHNVLFKDLEVNDIPIQVESDLILQKQEDFNFNISE